MPAKAEASSDSSPFSLEILDEVNDGKQLQVRGRVTAKSDWNDGPVLVRLSAIDEQGKTRVSYFPASVPSKAPPRVEAPNRTKPLKLGDGIEFALGIPSAGITDYQLELLWGADAVPFIRQALGGQGEFMALRNLEVQRGRAVDCGDMEDCPVQVEITGELFNSGSVPIIGVSLGAGLTLIDQGTNLDLSNQIPDNERRIDVRNMRLDPGAVRPIKLVLKEPVNGIEGLIWQPSVRIISFETDEGDLVTLSK